MDALQASFSLSIVFVAIFACALGGAGVAALRFGDRIAWPAAGSCVFFLCLGAQGLLAMLAMVCSSNCWFVFGAVLTAMSLGATIDWGRETPAGSW